MLFYQIIREYKEAEQIKYIFRTNPIWNESKNIKNRNMMSVWCGAGVCVCVHYYRETYQIYDWCCTNKINFLFCMIQI